MIFTGRYQDKTLNNEEHYLVRTSRGAPRWKLPYAIEDVADELIPPKELMNCESFEEFVTGYCAHLEETGPRRMRSLFSDLTESAARRSVIGKARKVVLLCFCDFSKVAYCHRQVLRDWARVRGVRVSMVELSQPEHVLPAKP